MSKGTIQEIKRILDDKESPEWKRSGQTLELAFRWIMDIIKEMGGGSRARLLLALSGLSQAMGTGIATMKELGPAIEKSQSGETLKNKILQNEKSLKHLRDIIQTSVKELRLLEQQETQYKALEAEKMEIENRLRWIEKHKDFDERSVDELRKQVSAIHKTKIWLRELEVQEGNLVENLPKTLELSDSTLKLIDKNTHQELETLEQNCKQINQRLQQFSEMRKNKEVEYEKLINELIAEQKRYENIDKIQASLSEVLKKYAQADHLLAQSLNTMDTKSVEDILDKVDILLEKADEILKVAIDANASANQIQRYPL